jgi:hypothetical protein
VSLEVHALSRGKSSDFIRDKWHPLSVGTESLVGFVAGILEKCS